MIKIILKRSRAGMTLVELSAAIVVMAIIALGMTSGAQAVMLHYQSDTVRQDIRQYGNNIMREISFDNLKKFNLKIDTKFVLKKKKKNENELLDLINKYKIKKKKSINTIYIHDPENLFLKSGRKTFNILMNLKKKKFFNKIGIIEPLLAITFPF